jgi:RimJ/RimL family protein N-acetyltransferase
MVEDSQMTAPSRLQLETVPLEGKSICLEPYDEAIKNEVRAALDCDAEAWNLFARSGQGVYFEQWWSHILHEVQAGQWIAYAIRDLASHKIVGTTSFLNIKHARCCVEIGATFIHPNSRSGRVNPESKYLMLQHAFRSGARRVELLTDIRNVRSQAAIAKLGAAREGVLRRERVTWTGHVRDSVIYSITDLDWPSVRQNLGARLAQLGYGVP